MTDAPHINWLGLDHVQVAAPPGGEADARRFYGDLLGLVEVEKPEALRAGGGVWFTCGRQQLHLGVSDDFAPARKAHPALAAGPGDLDRLAERLAAAGCMVQWDDAIPGLRRFYTADPWSNRIEVVGAPGDTGWRKLRWTGRSMGWRPPPTAGSPSASATCTTDRSRADET